MKKIYPLLLAFYLLSACLPAQTNILATNTIAEQVMVGNFNPADYAASVVIDDPQAIAADLQVGVNPDSLKSYIIRLSQFGTRNTGADTVSNTTGYGAARRWAYQKFQEFSAQNEDRLVCSYLQFDLDVCGMGQHRNVFAVLPGTDTSNHGVVLIEGHMDSRCNVLCDVDCPAEGVEDNASGTALVMELARVMAKYSFKNTIVFVITTGEEQGLLGAEAFADYIQEKNIPLRAVLNNDVIGGVICGQSSSPPSCPGLNIIDSTSVRLFSFGSFNSKHKQLARYIKLEYQENILPTATVPMLVRIMSPEDRTGRGGDHIPFREHNYPAMRFTAANEHGDASNGPGYTDRQHTSDDILGIDTDGDQIIDSFFVQFHYLARNAVINGNAAAMAARNVPTPTDFTAQRSGPQVTVTITDPLNIGEYRVAVRGLANDWDSVYTISNGLSGTFPCAALGPVYISIAGVDNSGVESLFSIEKPAITSGTADPESQGENFELYQNRPNPFDEATWISFRVQQVPRHQKAAILISDQQGRVIQEIPVQLKDGLNEVLYTHGYGVRGAFTYTLLIDGVVIGSRQMVFAG
ncbi:MAG: M28 family peptidase [Lewinellaceae bacterium]|nr:M28 family peptidase [Lewinellaceae bacterium]